MSMHPNMHSYQSSQGTAQIPLYKCRSEGVRSRVRHKSTLVLHNVFIGSDLHVYAVSCAERICEQCCSSLCSVPGPGSSEAWGGVRCQLVLTPINGQSAVYTRRHVPLPGPRHHLMSRSLRRPQGAPHPRQFLPVRDGCVSTSTGSDRCPGILPPSARSSARRCAELEPPRGPSQEEIPLRGKKTLDFSAERADTCLSREVRTGDRKPGEATQAPVQAVRQGGESRHESVAAGST